MDLDGTLYAIKRYGEIYTIDLQTMATTFVGDLGMEIAGGSFVLPMELAPPPSARATAARR